MARVGSDLRHDERTCTHCGQVVSTAAAFCEHCGARLAASLTAAAKASRGPVEPAPVDDGSEDVDRTASYLAEFGSRESHRLTIRLYEGHIGLLKRYRRSAKEVAHEIDTIEYELARLTADAVTPERTTAIQKGLERLEAVGDRWEDLQLSYNRDSEALDEEFLDRFAELEMDVELPDELNAKMQREVDVLTAALDRVGDRISSLGALGNGLIRSAGGRHFGTVSGSGTRTAHLPWALATMGAALVPRFVQSASWAFGLVAAATVAACWLLALIAGSKRS